MRRLLQWLLIPVAIAACIGLIATSESFESCVDNPHDTRTKQEPVKKVPAFLSVLRNTSACTGEILDKHGEAVTAFFTVVLAASTILLWLETRRISKAGEQQIAVAQAAAQAAEDAVIESSKMLAHAKEVADRDFRPWLTIDAKLSSEIGMRYSLEKGEVTFFVELSCANVGKAAARSIVYIVRGIDASVSDVGIWFDQLITDAIDVCYGDRGSLAPSETYTSRRWCRVPGVTPDNPCNVIPESQRVCQLCVGIVAAYRNTSSHEDDFVFYTAKVLPVGYPHLPEFHDMIWYKDLPVGVGDVAIGPMHMAKTV